MEKLLTRVITAPWTTIAVFTAVRLDLFSLLKDRYMTSAEIAAESDTNPDILKALLRTCEAMGFLRNERDQFGNTAFSAKYLVEGEPHYVGDLIKLQYHELENWGNLYNILLKNKRNDDSKESIHKIFIKAMNNLGQMGEVEALVDAVDLSSSQRMADLGGGSGLYSIALCQKYPQLQITLMDKKETLEVTREYLEDTSVKSRIILQEADIVRDRFEDKYDTVLLSDVVYDARSARLVLKNAFNCMCPGGQLIIRGYYSDPGGKDSLFSRLFVLQELVFDPRREVLNMSSLAEGVEKSGFDITKQGQLTARSQIFIARKGE